MKTIQLLFVSIFLISSCSFSSNFKITDSNYKKGGKRMAVLSALPNKMSFIYSSFLTKKLKKVSKFRLISQKVIKRRLGQYPVKIIGPYGIAAFDFIDVERENTDLAELKSMRKKLGVDYIYVIWAPNYLQKVHVNSIEVGSEGGEHTLQVIAQLFDFTVKNEVGYAKYNIRWFIGDNKSCLSIFAFGIPVVNKSIDALADAAEKDALVISEKLGMKR